MSAPQYDLNTLIEIAQRLSPLQKRILQSLKDKGPGLLLELAVRVLEFPDEVQGPLRELQTKGLVETQKVAGGDAAAIRLEQAYGSVQKLSLQLINGVLTRQRTRLLTDALRYELGDLEKFARRMIALSPQSQDDTIIDRVRERNVDEDAKKAYLAALVMNTFTRSALDDFIRERRNRA